MAAKPQSVPKSADLERPLPNNLDAERSVLGAILLDNHAMTRVVHAGMKPEDFFLNQHHRVFECMLALMEEERPLNLVTVIDELYKRGDLEAAGGSIYISTLIDGMPRVSHVEDYARMVKDKSLLRQLAHISYAVEQQALACEDSAEALIARATESLVGLSINAELIKDEHTYREAAIELVGKLEAPKPAVRAVTGLAELDEYTGGFCGGELVLVTASQTGVGKTILAEGIRRATCKRGGHGLYCSAEMTHTHLVGRGLAAEAGVRQGRIRSPERLTIEDKSALREAAMNECQFCTILSGELSLAKIRMSAQRLMRMRGTLSVIVVDYDELVSAPGKDDLDQQKNLVQGLKRLAVLVDVPVVLVSQLRKALSPSEAKKPSLERIYGTGAKSKHSSMVFFVDRPWVRELKGDEAAATVYIMKNRDGRKGKIECVFDVQLLRFLDKPKDPQEEIYPNKDD